MRHRSGTVPLAAAHCAVAVPLRCALHRLRWWTGVAAVGATAALLLGTGNDLGRRLAGGSNHEVLCGDGGHAPQTGLQGVLAFLYTCFALCTLLDCCNRLLPDTYRLPISVIMFAAGSGLGVLVHHLLPAAEEGDHNFQDWVVGMRFAARFDPHALIYIVIPPLVYESSAGMSWHVLRKVLPSAILLAGPGVLINTILTGIFVRLVFRLGHEPPDWSASILLGAILSANDPVAVVAALGSLGAPAKLSTIVDGEALINDGTAVVVAIAARDWTMTNAPASEKFCTGAPPEGSCIVGYFCQVAIGGCGIGVAAGLLLRLTLDFLKSARSVELDLTMVFVSVYGAFYIGEAAKTSGILATVVLGMFVAANVKPHMTSAMEHAHHAVLTQFCFMCNQVLFFAAGTVSVHFMWTNTGCDHDYTEGRAWGELAALYVAVHATRLGMVALLLPALKRLGYGLTWQESVVLVFGGLRGGLALVMALIMEHNDYIDPAVKQMLVFHTAGIVLLTLTLNGTMVDAVYSRLKDGPNPFSGTRLQKVLTELEPKCKKEASELLANDWLLQDVQLSSLSTCIPDFSAARFDRAGIPHPDNASPVREMLASVQEEKVSGLSAFLRCQKGAPLRDQLTRAFQASVDAGPGEAQDLLYNVASAGSCLWYRPGPRKRPGVFASNTCWERIMTELDGAVVGNGGLVGFNMAKVLGVCVTVGLQQRSPGAETVQDIRHVKDAHHAITVDCSSGAVFCSLPEAQVRLMASPTPVGPTESIIFEVGQQDGGTRFLGVKLATGVSEPPLQLATVTLGPSTGLHCLYPVVELHCVDTPSQLHLPRPFHATSSSQEDRSPRPAPPSAPGGPTVRSAWDAPCLSPRGERSRGLDSMAPASSHELKQHREAEVILGFEPHIASSANKIAEVLHVYLNTVAHGYSKLRERGLISDQAALWLNEAMLDAAECANGEVNSKHAEDYDRERRGLRATVCGACFSSGRSSQVIPSLLEPLVVELRSLQCSTSCSSPFWGRVTGRCMASDPDLQSKVGCLWAFVTVHEEALHSAAATEHPPEFADHVECVTSEARQVLFSLAPEQPQAFAQAKHALALKLLLERRLQALRKSTESGWVSPAEAEHMLLELSRLMEDASRFRPYAPWGWWRKQTNAAIHAT